MISAISSSVSSATGIAAYATWAKVGRQAQSGSAVAVPASSPNTVASTSGSELDSAVNDSQTDATTSSASADAASDQSTGESSGSTAGNDGLTQDEQSEVTELKQRDEEVRTHEQAHQSAGAGLTGAVSYTYQTGPDGKRYAVGGEVSIDTSPVRNSPSQTIRKMEQVIAAALAPADPSGQDRAVAAQAGSTIVAAEMELALQKKNTNSSSSTGSTINTVA
jgi:hypothetical protein